MIVPYLRAHVFVNKALEECCVTDAFLHILILPPMGVQVLKLMYTGTEMLFKTHIFSLQLFYTWSS